MTTSHVLGEREPRCSGWAAYCAAARALRANGETVADPEPHAKEDARDEQRN
jgi:hypothetical protein